jgi:nitrate/nitrite transporter NarK
VVGRRRFSTVGLIVLGQSYQSLPFAGMALFLPLIRADLGLSFAQAGTLSAVSMLVYAAMQIPAGLLADRHDPRRLFTVGLLGTNLAAMLFAVVGDYHLLLLVQSASGVFRALIFTPGLLLIRAQFPGDRQATAMGLFVAAGFSSNILLNLLGPVLVGPLGWQLLFVLLGASGLVTAVAFHRVGAGADRPPPGVRPAGGLRRLLTHPVLLLTGVIQFARLALVFGFSYWLPTFLVERGESLRTAGLVVALGAALTAPSNLVGGWISDRLQRPLLVIGTSLAVLAGTLAVLPALSGMGPLIAAVALMSVFVQLYFGPLFAVPLQHFGAGAGGLTSGFGNFCANLGGFTFTYALGALRDVTGSFALGFWLLAGLAAVALVATTALSRLPAATPVRD